MTIVPRHVLVTHTLRPAPSCSQVLPLHMTWHTHTAFKCTFCRRHHSGREGCAPTLPPRCPLCQKLHHPSQTHQLLQANPKWQNWRQMKKHRGRTTNNAVQTKGKKKGGGNQTISQKKQHCNFKVHPFLGMEGSNNHNVPISAFTDMYHF